MTANDVIYACACYAVKAHQRQCFRTCFSYVQTNGKAFEYKCMANCHNAFYFQLCFHIILYIRVFIFYSHAEFHGHFRLFHARKSIRRAFIYNHNCTFILQTYTSANEMNTFCIYTSQKYPIFSRDIHPWHNVQRETFCLPIPSNWKARTKIVMIISLAGHNVFTSVVIPDFIARKIPVLPLLNDF